MSALFTNINVRSEDQQTVAAAVRRLPKRLGAFVGPPVNGWVTVFDEASDAPDEDRLSGYTVMLSEKLGADAIGFLVYESDVLIYTLARNGVLTDHYSSWPDYFDENLPDREMQRLAGKAGDLAKVSNPPVPRGKVRSVLDAEHDFAEEKLLELVKLLGLPENAAQWGYNDILEAEETGEHPAGWDRFIRITPAFQTL